MEFVSFALRLTFQELTKNTVLTGDETYSWLALSSQ